VVSHLELRSATYDGEDSADRVSGLSGDFCVVGGHRMFDVCDVLVFHRVMGVCPIRGVDEVARHLG
jgi:hypothetical protein